MIQTRVLPAGAEVESSRRQVLGASFQFCVSLAEVEPHLNLIIRALKPQR